jgi:hypothetical protein
MGKSKKRGGEKEHRKRVAKRNQEIATAREKYTKEFQRLLDESIKKKELDANQVTNDQSLPRPFKPQL